MRLGGGARVAICVLLLTAAACGENAGQTRASVSESDEPATCEPGFSEIAGLEQTKSYEEPFADHVGIRLDFEDGDHRQIHYFAGIAGEFGEGLPAAEQVSVAAELEATLLGQDTTWVLAWDASGLCGRRAVLGDGLTHDEFLETIRSAGIIPAA